MNNTPAFNELDSSISPPPLHVRKLVTSSVAALFPTPTSELGEWLSVLGCKLFPRDRPVVQYVAWCHEIGLLALLSRGAISIEAVCADTPLTESGADALLGVLCSLGIAVRQANGRCRLADAARDYFSPDSPFYIGDQLCPPPGRMPPPYLKNRPESRVWLKMIHLLPSIRYGTTRRLLNQNVRNMPACVAAVRSGEFAETRCLVDLAGGGGAFAVPLALEYPKMRIVLTDLPAALKNVPPILAKYGLENRIELLGMDAFAYPWKIPECDGIFIGNFLHGFPDEACVRICREAYERLEPGGKLWVHEMLWNANKDGPLITGLWNASMRVANGAQRTAEELKEILRAAGFESPYVVPSISPFSLLAAQKRA